MADVFNDIKIEWLGETYTFRPTNRLLRRIEGELSPSSLTDVLNRMNAGKPPISETAFIVAKFLEAGGAEPDVADEDRVYGEIMNDFAENDGEGFVALCKTIVIAISPSEHTGKKSSAVSNEGAGKEAAKPAPNKSKSKKKTRR